MSKGFPDINKAYEYLQFAEKCLLEHQESTDNYRNHCINVSKAAKLIASEYRNLDATKAEVMGLLHDIGKYQYEDIVKRHHSVTGYEYMMSEGYHDVARTCLTHTFPLKYFDEITEGFFHHNEKDIKFIKDFFDNNEFDKYDEILQVADILSLPYGFVRIEERFAEMLARYKLKDMGKSINAYKSVKDKLSREIGEDIYKVLSII